MSFFEGSAPRFGHFCKFIVHHQVLIRASTTDEELKRSFKVHWQYSTSGGFWYIENIPVILSFFLDDVFSSSNFDIVGVFIGYWSSRQI